MITSAQREVARLVAESQSDVAICNALENVLLRDLVSGVLIERDDIGKALHQRLQAIVLGNADTNALVLLGEMAAFQHDDLECCTGEMLRAAVVANARRHREHRLSALLGMAAIQKGDWVSRVLQNVAKGSLITAVESGQALKAHTQKILAS